LPTTNTLAELEITPLRLLSPNTTLPTIKKETKKYEKLQLSEEVVHRLKDMYKEAEHRFTKIKKPKRKAELAFLNLCENLNNKDTQQLQYNNLVNPDVLNTLHQSIRSLKLVYEYSEDSRQIAFNLDEFMLIDTLYSLFSVSKVLADMATSHK
jgi:hypothetical protein